MKKTKPARSRRASSRTSSPTLDGAFFHEDLAPGSSFGGAPVASSCGPLDPDLFEAARLHELREAFATSRPQLVTASDALPPSTVKKIARALKRSAFVPHHHSAYPLHVTRPDAQHADLRAFTSWLETPHAARVHQKLAGLRTDRVLTQIQVQTSRMRAGESFPPHVDTMDDALAAIYNFTELVPGGGGELVFLDERGAVTAVVPPFMGRLALFASGGVPHCVREVTRGERYSVTAFYVVE